MTDRSDAADDDADGVAPPVRPPIPGPAGRFATIGMPVERSADFGNSTRRLLGRMRPERTNVVLVIVLAVVSVALSVSGPQVLGRATDVIFEGLRSPRAGDRLRSPAPDPVDRDRAVRRLGDALLAAVVRPRRGGPAHDAASAGRGVEDKLNRLPLPYVDRQPRGDLLSRVTNDIDNIAQSLQQTLSMMLTSTLSLVGVLGMMLWISPLLALVAVTTIPLSLLTIRTVAKRSKGRFIAQWRHTGTLNAQVEEAFTGHSLVKVFGRRHDVEQRFREKNDELYAASFGAQFISGIIQPSMMFLGNLNYVAIAVIGGLQVANGSMSLGEVQAFIQYSRQFTMPLTQLASMANVFQSGIASAERVFELLDAEEEVEEHADPASVPHPQGRVEFDHVSFSYDPDRPLIKDLSFVAEPGQTVAIVGPTGAGKTTLVNLIMRFYELDSGRITLDGQDISHMRRADLRSNVGMVLQDTWLFGGTIRDNIAYGNPRATEERAARRGAGDLRRPVRPLACPTATTPSSTTRAATVSAGEKQLITIARAFLAQPAMLILDEATSSVDTRTEVLIQRAMAALRQHRTSFVIAHRLSTIRDADVILVMEDGQIVEQGSHAELLAAGGAYWSLYNAQFTGAVAVAEA